MCANGPAGSAQRRSTSSREAFGNYCESFNSKLRDELLNMELFTTLHEAHSSKDGGATAMRVRPHSSLDYRAPAPETILPPASTLPYAAFRPNKTLADTGRIPA